MHDIISVGLPLVAILAGILFNRSDIREIRSKLKRLEAKIDDNRDAAHRDTLEILRAMTSLHARVAVVEDPQNR